VPSACPVRSVLIYHCPTTGNAGETMRGRNVDADVGIFFVGREKAASSRRKAFWPPQGRLSRFLTQTLHWKQTQGVGATPPADPLGMEERAFGRVVVPDSCFPWKESLESCREMGRLAPSGNPQIDAGYRSFNPERLTIPSRDFILNRHGGRRRRTQGILF
jgi:hypothetical protein